MKNPVGKTLSARGTLHSCRDETERTVLGNIRYGDLVALLVTRFGRLATFGIDTEGVFGELTLNISKLQPVNVLLAIRRRNTLK